LTLSLSAVAAAAAAVASEMLSVAVSSTMASGSSRGCGWRRGASVIKGTHRMAFFSGNSTCAVAKQAWVMKKEVLGDE
jgi:hypothetical protein